MDEWQKRHEKEHEVLEVRLMNEARREAADMVKGALSVVDGFGQKLTVLEKHARLQSKERRTRRAEDKTRQKTKEENRKLWEWRWKMVGRAFFGFGGAATILELVRMYLATKGH